jgi:acyl-CoA reductase-like NAD-dependent aldehyde dehydrogenase
MAKPPVPPWRRIRMWTRSPPAHRSGLILQAAAGNLKKVSLELGGKSPNVVFNDGDLKTAISGSASAIFFNHGQCRCAGS